MSTKIQSDNKEVNNECKPVSIEVTEFRPPEISKFKYEDPAYSYYGESKALLEKYGVEQACGEGYELVRRNEGREELEDPEGKRLAGTNAPRGKLSPDNYIEQGDNVFVRCRKEYAESRAKYYREKDAEHIQRTKVVKGKDAADIVEQRMKDAGVSRSDIDRRLTIFKGGARDDYVVMNQ